MTELVCTQVALNGRDAGSIAHIAALNGRDAGHSRIIDRGVTAPPPDVRRGYASPLRAKNSRGCAPGSGYALILAKGRTSGIAAIKAVAFGGA